MNSTHQIGVYVHVPFCRKKCGYCDFFSLISNPDHPRLTEFSKAVVREFDLVATRFKHPPNIRTIFLGGGTPSLLSIDQLEKIISGIQETFVLPPQVEFTIEMNPGTVDKEKLEHYRALGINRISVGVQAFQDHLLKRLDRIHTAEMAVTTVELARSAGFANINLDLIFGIPGQSRADWHPTLEQAVELKPEHIAVYNLTYEDGTPFHKLLKSGKLSAVSEETEEKFYFTALEFLKKHRFDHYEISNFSRPGFSCEHNLGYWNYSPYLGFGPSAHSFDGETRRWNEPNLETYLKRLQNGHLPVHEIETLNRNDRMHEWVFLQMRQSQGLNLEKFQKQFCLAETSWNQQLEKEFGKKWSSFFLLKEQNLLFTRSGFWLSDELLPGLLRLFSRLMTM